MALKKEIVQEDGVLTDYHRIIYVMSVINSHTSIAVMSYVSDAVRAEEKNKTLPQPYHKNIVFETEYENMTVENAYSFLKTLDIFSGAEDV